MALNVKDTIVKLESAQSSKTASIKLEPLQANENIMSSNEDNIHSDKESSGSKNVHSASPLSADCKGSLQLTEGEYDCLRQMGVSASVPTNNIDSKKELVNIELRKVTSQRHHADSRENTPINEVHSTKVLRIESESVTNSSKVISKSSERQDLLYPEKMERVRQDSSRMYQMESLQPQFVYFPTLNEKESALRQVYLENMIQQQLRWTSAFQKPVLYRERGNEEEQFYRSSIQFVPNYLEQTSSREILDRQESDTRNTSFCGTNITNNLVEKEKMAEIKMYETMPHRYFGFRQSVPIPYLPYRTPILHNVHQNGQYVYPCCGETDKLKQYIDPSKLSPCVMSPMREIQDIKTHTDKEIKNMVFPDPNDMHPSFKAFLEAERERLAADGKLAPESGNKASISKSLITHKKTWNLNNKLKKVPEIHEKKLMGEHNAITKQSNEKTVTLKEEETTETMVQKDTVGAPDDNAKSSFNEEPPPVKKISCSICNKTFNRTSNLYTHMRTHSTHKPHVCEFCGKRFHQKADLRIHRYIHTGEKPHKCTKCGRGFKQLTHLKYHMRTHSDVRMYKCPYCEKGFNQKSNLQAHIFGHTGQRPHKCDVCGKGFTLASTLNTHKRTHLPNKPFQCQFCERAFYQKNALKMHYVSTHPYSSGAV